MSLDDTSTVTVARGEHLAAQPDLKLFAATGFPYIGSTGFDLALASRDPATTGAGWTLAARLAQIAGRILPEGRMIVGPPKANRHVIVVGAAPDLAAAVVAAGPVGVQGGALPYETAGPLPLHTPSLLQSLREWAGMTTPPESPAAPPLSHVQGSGNLGLNGVLIAARAPGGGAFTLTTLTAGSREALWTTTQSLVGPVVWPNLDEDVTLWRPTTTLRPTAPGNSPAPDAMFTQRVGATFHVGSFGTLYAARYFIGEYPLVWLAIIAVCVLLLVAMLRFFLVGRRRRVHPGSLEGIP